MKKQAAREREMDSFFAHLEAKYAEPEKKKSKKSSATTSGKKSKGK